MATITHDQVRAGSTSRTPWGAILALVSAASFGMSGSLADGLFGTGWSPGAVVLARVGISAVVVTPVGLWAMRGRWSAVRRSAALIATYGLLAVAGSQFCYFAAVQQMQVGPAILIEYTSPAAVVLWLWLVRGHRPGRTTLMGAVLAAVGLVLVLDIIGGVSVSAAGVAWALCAMVGATAYFLINADVSTGVPPLGLAWLGLIVGTLVLVLVGVTGLMPLHASTSRTELAGHATPWWVPVLVLGVVTSALAYCTGVAAGRRLGSRLASFIALFEIVSSVGFAWALLGQLPHAIQLVGGLLILAGVVVVRLGEGPTAIPEPAIEVLSADPAP
jgi:drug/metabolite transporter (DMT)-like permease